MKVQCISCGRAIEVEPGSDVAACPYCDTVFDLVQLKPISAPVKRKASGYSNNWLIKILSAVCLLVMLFELLTVVSLKVRAWENAISYVRRHAYSYEGLVERLCIFYPYDAAVFAADHSFANWKKEASQAATEAVGTDAFSYEGLKDYLLDKKFTPEEIQYAMENLSVDWNQEAVEAAQESVTSIFFNGNILDYLKEMKFTQEQAEYGANHCQIDWYD